MGEMVMEKTMTSIISQGEFGRKIVKNTYSASAIHLQRLNINK